MILPWAIDGLPDDSAAQHEPSVDQTGLASQPLTGLRPGVSVREVSQPELFSLVALTSEDPTGTTASVRAKRADGSWGPWYLADTVDSEGPAHAGAPGPRGTEPIFVGRTTTVQIAVTRAAPRAPSVGSSVGGWV